jgi:hypothetical protein
MPWLFHPLGCPMNSVMLNYVYIGIILKLHDYVLVLFTQIETCDIATHHL